MAADDGPEGKTMKQLMVAVVAGMVMAAAVMVSIDTMPMLQVSARTKEPVACASRDTNWEVRGMNDPVCQQVAKGQADVEWVP